MNQHDRSAQCKRIGRSLILGAPIRKVGGIDGQHHARLFDDPQRLRSIERLTGMRLAGGAFFLTVDCYCRIRFSWIPCKTTSIATAGSFRLPLFLLSKKSKCVHPRKRTGRRTLSQYKKPLRHLFKKKRAQGLTVCYAVLSYGVFERLAGLEHYHGQSSLIFLLNH